MRQVVSIWLGYFQNQAELDSYLKEIYTVVDDSLASPFSEQFELPYYDNDFQEAFCGADSVGTDTASSQRLLEPLSYSATFMAEVLKDIPSHTFNSVIALYDFRYHGRVKQTGTVIYIGNYSYHSVL